MKTRSRYGIKDVAKNRALYDKKYYRANREKILSQHAQRYHRIAGARPEPPSPFDIRFLLGA